VRRTANVRTNEGVWGVVEKKHEWIGEAAGGSSFFRRATLDLSVIGPKCVKVQVSTFRPAQ
jgi:hypothetical protein